MKKLWGWLRTLNGGDWIALLVVVCGTAFVVALAVANTWASVVGSLQPEMAKVKGTDYDLIAQRSMAAAAWWMVMITTLSALVGAFGLYLIARTLQEAKRSADAAHLAVAAANASADVTLQIGRAQARAYLVIAGATLVIKDRLNAKIDIRIRNSGQTPAKEVWTHLKFFADFADDNPEEVPDYIPEDMEVEYLSDISSSNEQIVTYDLPAYEFHSLANANPDEPAFPSLYVFVDWEDVFGGKDTIGARLSCVIENVHASRTVVLSREEM